MSPDSNDRIRFTKKSGPINLNRVRLVGLRIKEIGSELTFGSEGKKSDLITQKQVNIQLKPVHRKALVRDCREHRKQSFYMVLAALDWSDVFNVVDINKAVELLEEKILAVMDKCMPQKSVRMSSSDPVWMSLLVKCMLRSKSRISLNNNERLCLFNKRISEVITENR